MAVERRTVPDAVRGTRLDAVVASLLGEPRSRSQERLDRGEVTVDGTTVRKSYRVRGGERIEVVDTPDEPGAPPPPVVVRYEDADVAVVVKPSGLVVHAGAGVHDGTLVDALDAMGMPLAPSDDPARPGIVHRLDRGTSGLLAVAKSAAALTGLRAQFDEHTVGRRYWALVDGVPEHQRATVDAPIARHPQQRVRFRTASDGRPSVSHYEVERSWDDVSCVWVQLETGRTHQVRVHMSALGHPVCADRVYGASAAVADALGLRRPALHAGHLRFSHPVSGVSIDVDEPLPDDLQRAVDRLDAGIATSA